MREKFLYRASNARLSGMSNSSRDVEELAGKTAGTLQYTLSYQDQGARSGRSRITIDTNQRSGTVWSDNAPTFRVDLRMEPPSLPTTGEPLWDPENRKERLAETIVRTAPSRDWRGRPAWPSARCARWT